MTIVTLPPFPVFRAFDANGAPLAGGLLYSYAGGTTTPLVTYADDAGNVNANPVVLDSSGSANVRLSTLPYKLVLKDAAGTTQWTVDNINPPLTVNFGVTGLSPAVDTALSNPLGTALVFGFSITGKSLLLPVANAANSIPKGVPIVIYNTGNVFTLKTQDGLTTIGTIQAGGAILTLVDNSTANGTWKINAVAATTFTGARVSRTSDMTSIADNTGTVVTWQQADEDTSSFWSAGSPTRFTVPNGVSRVSLKANFPFVPNAADGYCAVSITKNGSTFDGHGKEVAVFTSATATFGVMLNVSCADIPVSAGDYFELSITQKSGGTATSPHGVNMWFAIKAT